MHSTVHSTVQPTVSRTRARRRHLLVAASFALLVLAPTLLAAGYLYLRAADQYASYVGFSVRSEETRGTSIDSLLGATALGGSRSADTDILYAFLRSPQPVADIDATLDLRAIWARPGTGLLRGDPVFAFGGGTIEDLHDQWARMVRVRYDSTTALLDIRVLAFTPGDAEAIAQAIYDRAGELINEVSAVARADAVAEARRDLRAAEARLRAARLALGAFRNRAQTLDPATAGQSGLVAALEEALVSARIDRAILGASGVRAGAPNAVKLDRRIAVIEAELATERGRIGGGASGAVTSGAVAGEPDAGETVAGETVAGETVADRVGTFEALKVDLAFAEEAHAAARARHDAALTEARRTTRYLAAHLAPTRAQQAEYPRRGMYLGLIALFLTVAWSIGVLVGYALRDRR
ncbi:MAG: capsule biosynthesis protein [Pseudomonadota bacterium]